MNKRELARYTDRSEADRALTTIGNLGRTLGLRAQMEYVIVAQSPTTRKPRKASCSECKWSGSARGLLIHGARMHKRVVPEVLGG